MRASPLKPFAPRKRFGQHFLIDQHIVHRIVSAINPTPGDHLLEIGPGQGVLTAPLLDKLTPTDRLDMVELDNDLIPLLTERFNNQPQLHVHHADILAFQIKTLKTSQDSHVDHDQSSALRVVGNLPYNISTPLLFHLFESIDVIQDMHFMLQKEVVDRLAASPNTAAYGRLSVMVQYHCTVKALFDVPPQAFHPPPKVMSGVVRLKPLAQRPITASNFPRFKAIVSAAFNQRRKMLRKSLSDYLTPEQIRSQDIDPRARPETLSVWEFVRLSHLT